MRYYEPNDIRSIASADTGVGTAGAPDPGAPPAPPAPKVETFGGYTPDYGGLIKSDPAFIASSNASTQAAETAAARRRAQIRSAFVQYGGDLPPGFQDTYGDIDPATKDAAAGNQNSVFANLASNYSKSLEQFRRGLAARGGLQSSELDYGGDQLSRGFGQQRYDAANAFTGQANDAYSGYAGVLGQNAQNMASAIGTAEGNVYSNPAYRPSAPTFADYDAASSATYGAPVYKGEDGNLYDANGNPFTPQTDWRTEDSIASGYSPGVSSSGVASLYGGY